MITADLVARAVIAAAISYGDDPAVALTSTFSRDKRSALAAAEALTQAGGITAAKACGMVNVHPVTLSRVRGKQAEGFVRAVQASLDALGYARRSLELQERGVQVAPAPKPPKRAFPRGAVIENRGDGVQVIRLKPVTPNVVRHVAAQVAKGADIGDLADLFDVDEEHLRRALKAAGV